jgi:hypothetical protein
MLSQLFTHTKDFPKKITDIFTDIFIKRGIIPIFIIGEGLLIMTAFPYLSLGIMLCLYSSEIYGVPLRQK